MNIFPSQGNASDLMRAASQINQFNNYNVVPNQTTILDEVRNKLTSLTSDELISLRNMQEFAVTFETYQAGLQEYVMNKFAYEYANTDKGRSELTQVNSVIDTNIGIVRERARQEKEKLSMLSKLLEENPELIKQLEGSKNGKNSK